MKIIKHTFPFIIILIGIIIYSNVLHGPIIFDDGWYIEDNAWIKNISNFLNDFSSTRYVGFLSLAINFYFGGMNTFGYHIINILIHIINALLVYLLVQFSLNRIKDTGYEFSDHFLDYLPIAVSLIFLVHPIQTQTVSYITQRFTSLATLFYLLAIIFYFKARIKGQNGCAKGQENKYYIYIPFYILSVLSAILAMKTKEISFTLPIMIVLYEIIFISTARNKISTGINNNDSNLKTRLFYFIPYLLTSFIISLNFLLTTEDTSSTQSNIVDELRHAQFMDIKNISQYSYFLTQFRVIITYIRLLVLPINQTFKYDYPVSESIFESATLISAIILIFIIIITMYIFINSLRTKNIHGILISFGIAWFFITLSIESSLIPIKDVIFEHRLYLPSIGFFMAILSALSYGITKSELYCYRTFTTFLLTASCMIILILSIATYKRNVLWNNSYLMYKDNISKYPNIAHPHNWLATELFNQKRLIEAIEEYKTAIRLDPDYAMAYYDLGRIYNSMGRDEESIELYKKAIRLLPSKTAAAFNNLLGNTYYKLGRMEHAMEEYKTAIKLKPEYPTAHYNLGNAYSKLGRIEEAIEEYKKTIRLEPGNPEDHYVLGMTYAKNGQREDAINEFKLALSIRPDFVKAQESLDKLSVKQ